MGTAKIKVNVIEEKGKLKQKFATIMEDYLMFEEGRKEEMTGKYQISLFQTKEELDKIISTL